MTFYDPVESSFYASCLENLLLSAPLRPTLAGGLVEIGAGTAIPVIDALRRCESTLAVRGFELDDQSYRVARRMVDKAGLPNYTVVPGDFFAHAPDGPERCAIGNPPYLPAATAAMGAPELWGGDDGADVSRRVLSSGFDVVLLMVSSISDPHGLLDHARRAGYTVHDWAARPVTFGEYSADPAVRSRIDALGAAGKAFYTTSSYTLAGVTWVRDDLAPPSPLDPTVAVDHTDVLEQVLTSKGTTTRP